MAATNGTLSKRQQDNIRDAIKTTQLVKRLQCFALEELGDQGEVVEINKDRLKAIETLLKKTLPDLSSVQIGGDSDNPVQVHHRIERVIVDPKRAD